MALKVEILSSEIIKPSSPTPESLRSFKLSFLDQLAPADYIPLILFYPTSTSYLGKSSNVFRQSLSKALNHMYPLAGRINDIFAVKCKDQGVEYIEARVSGNMSTVLKHPKYNFMQQLLPPNPEETSTEPKDQVLLSVQINIFECGGTAVGVLVRHRIADFSAACTFLKTWAAIARGENIVDSFIVDRTTVFPPRDVSILTKPQNRKGEECRTKACRFIFDYSNIAALKEKAIKSQSFLEPPSRVVAVSAFIWATLIAADGGRTKNWLMTTLVNLRNRMYPPIFQHSLGNVYDGLTVKWQSLGETVDYGVLVKLVQDAIGMVNPEFIKKYADAENLNNYVQLVSEFLEYRSQVRTLMTSSWCRSPIYEIDFGLGKPIWVGTTYPKSINAVNFMDTSNGEGIEAWMRLSEEDMNKVEQNPDFLAYVSSSQSL